MRPRSFNIVSVTGMAFVAIVISSCLSSGSVLMQRPDSLGKFEFPVEHMPPKGDCRIWYPDLPPALQTPPGSCYDLERRVPDDAVLIRG